MDNLKPIEHNQRTSIVDVLRGWALLSVIIVNFTIFYSFHIVQRVPNDDFLSKFFKLMVNVFFQSKGWTLLAFLFGYGFSVLLSNIKKEAKDPALIFSRRMFWLLIIAIVNCCLYYGDVLKDYVIVGMVILLFHRTSEKHALPLAIICFLVFPALIPLSQKLQIVNPISIPDLALYKSPSLSDVVLFNLKSSLNIVFSFSKYFDWNLIMLACGFAGVFTHKSGFFEHLANNKKLLGRLLWSSLAFAIFSVGIRQLIPVVSGQKINLDDYYDVEMWFSLGLMVFFMAVICSLYVNGKCMRLFCSFQAVGKMTLTNYLVQNLVALLIFSGFGLGLLHKLPYSLHAISAISIFVLQIFFSNWWLSKYKFGPVEWLWRALSYQTRFSNRKRVN